MQKIKLTYEWELGDKIGSGGFGTVYTAKSPLCECAVAKIVPKSPSANRELLFISNNDLNGVQNVIPVIDRGETDNDFVLIMPRAEKSLRQYLNETTNQFCFPKVVEILSDIATGLVDIEKKEIIHRDIKPENVLLLNDHWCLADFGISRYAESTTAPDTRKFALSPSYAAPERWRNERASIATDIYSLGIIAYELLSESPPFTGPMYEDFREQHLQNNPQPLSNVPPAMEALVNECLYKHAKARPSPTAVLHRLEKIGTDKPLEGLAKLEEANLAEVTRKGESSLRQSKQISEAKQRKELFSIASEELIKFTDSLQEQIIQAASAATPKVNSNGWIIQLGQARLEFKEAAMALQHSYIPNFDVIAYASLLLHTPPSNGYKGRSHSFWYADAQESERYQWFETAFMVSPLIPKIRKRLSQDPFVQNPFALSPNKNSAEAVRPGMGKFQVAWPFTPLIAGDLDEFINRWTGWFADAANGQLRRSQPELPTEGSWRR